MDEKSPNVWQSLLDLPAYDDKAEDVMAANLTSSIDAELARIRNSTGFGCRSWERQNLRFEKNLIRFARKRRISFKQANWHVAAMRVAAEEHKDLNPTKKPRGRPRSNPRGGLLSLVSKVRDRELAIVTRIKQNAEQRTGKPMTWKQACEIAVYALAKAGDKELDPNSELFHSNVRTWRTRVSEQRKLQKNGT